MKLYSTHHPDTKFPALNTISTYAAHYPAPGSSSGWFFPAQDELGMMGYGMTDGFSGSFPDRRDLLNDLFPKAGEERLAGSYWTSITYLLNRVWYLDFDGTTNYGVNLPSNTYKVRAVLAF